MKKYLVLYMAPIAEMEKMMANSNPEQQKEGMIEWRKWMETHKDMLTDMGAPLGKTKRVTSSGVTDAKNDVGGYSIVQAESHEEAAKLFQDSPHFQIPGGYIDVVAIGEMPSA